MIFPVEYENALKAVSDTIRKLELDLEMHKVLFAHLRVVVEKEKRKHPTVNDTT